MESGVDAIVVEERGRQSEQNDSASAKYSLVIGIRDKRQLLLGFNFSSC